ncbi:DUF2231 domain-containing protein [Actinomadura syzygii]|uniref:DUF2231 domain-containing protein n=1 Tax=Actinomadura syzygii TaxID=1427538 RepID=A0A5D0TQZ2_9ACTN|nr:DUF2231 domain-containing protein [Actinomadura syzygii]TYC08548.1 hypothetical protein FXF65_37265 [Actinomadura syzygii]
MPNTVWGLPVHPLIVHIVVFLVPLTVLAALTVALWPRARRLLAPWVLGLATVAVVTIPLATESGEHLEAQVPRSSLVEEHAELADTLLPLAAALWGALAVIVAVGLYVRRNADRPERWANAVTLVAVVLTVGLAASTGVQVIRIGHSGANAVWHDVGSRRTAP